MIGGVRQAIHLFCLDLPQSDAGFVKAYPAERTASRSFPGNDRGSGPAPPRTPPQNTAEHFPNIRELNIQHGSPYERRCAGVLELPSAAESG